MRSPCQSRAGIERVGDHDSLSAIVSCCRAIGELSLVRFDLPPFTGPHSPGSFFGFTPSDRGQPPLTPLSLGRRLAAPPSPRIVSARLASTRRASSIPGASVSELSSRGPRSQFPAVACHVAALTVTILDHPPPRRGLATAPRLPRSLSARSPRLSPGWSCGDLDRSSDRGLPSCRPREVSRSWAGGGASLVNVCQVHPIREHDPRIVEPLRPVACHSWCFRTAPDRVCSGQSGSVALEDVG